MVSGDGRSGDQRGSGESFHVQDRRRFDPRAGATRPDDQAASVPSAGAPAPEPGDIELPGGGVLHGHPPAEEPVRPVRFDDLVQPFLLMGLSGLGVIPHPESGEAQPDEGTARFGIECLELLKTRTEGHRTPEESRLLEAALYELKLQFVELRDRHRGT